MFFSLSNETFLKNYNSPPLTSQETRLGTQYFHVDERTERQEHYKIVEQKMFSFDWFVLFTFLRNTKLRENILIEKFTKEISFEVLLYYRAFMCSISFCLDLRLLLAVLIGMILSSKDPRLK